MTKGSVNQSLVKCGDANAGCTSGFTENGFGRHLQSYECKLHNYSLCLECAIKRRNIPVEDFTDIQRNGYIQIWFENENQIEFSAL
jgi:hypothetical protein